MANANSRVKLTASNTNFYISWMVAITGTLNSNLYGCVINPDTSQLDTTYSIVSDKRFYYSIASNGSSFFVCWKELWKIETILMGHNFGKIISIDGVPSDHTVVFNGPLAGFMSLPEISSDGSNYCVMYPVIDPYIPDIYAAHLFLLDGSGKILKHLKAPIPLRGAGDFFDIAYFSGMYGLVFYDMHSPQDQPAGISFFDRYLQPVTVDIDDLAGTPYIGFQGLTPTDNGLFLYLSETGDDYQPHFLSVGSNSSPIHADTDNDGLTDFQEFSIYHTNPSFSDTDNDGLTDYAELNEHLTNPTLTDTDNDGISDGFEINRYQTNPHSADTDNDGLTDSQELSQKYYDGFESGDFLALPWTVHASSQITDYTVYDGAYAVKIHGLSIDLDLPTTTEVSFYFKAGFDTADPLGGAFLPLQVYLDEHSYDWSDTYDWFDSYDWHIGSVIVPAGQHTLTFAGYMTSDPTTSIYLDEVTIAPDGTDYPTDPLNPDTDNDGLLDGEEIAYNLNPTVNDASTDNDNDGMSDLWEIRNALNPLVNDSDNDQDNDGVSNLQEFFYSTDPFNQDTDNDGLTDKQELNLKSNIFAVNSSLSADKLFPDVASVGNGYFVVWQTDDEQDNDTYDIFGQLFDADGVKIGAEFQIATGSVQAVSIIAVGNNYIVCWPTQDAIMAQCFDMYGNTLGDAFQVNTSSGSNTIELELATDGTNCFALWRNLSPALPGQFFNTVLYGQIFGAQGVKIGAELQLALPDDSISKNMFDIASNGSNYLVISAMNEGAMQAQLFDVSGTQISAEFLMDSYDIIFPFSVSDGSNYFITYSWLTYVSDGQADPIPYDGTIVYPEPFCKPGKIYDANGGLLIDGLSVSPLDDIIFDGINYLGVWELYSDRYNLSFVYTQFYDTSGNIIGEPLYIGLADHHSSDLNGSTTPAVASNGSNLFVCWTSKDDDNDGLNIYGCIVTPGVHTDPLNPDTDNDGLTDGEEIIDLLTNPLNPDTDKDGMIDGDEVYAGMEPDNEHSLFCIKDIEFDSTANNMHINWFGSVVSPDIGYDILWRDPSSGQWNRIDPNNNAIQNTNGIRSWIDEGDNDATPPRPQPSCCGTRLYKVVVE